MKVPEFPALETPVRVQRFMEGNDMAMAALMFQYGRYLLISSSQPGGSACQSSRYLESSPMLPGIVNIRLISMRR